MKPCTIADLGKLTEITDVYHVEEGGIHLRVRSDLLGVTFGTWFLDGDKAICFERIGRRKAQVHIYSVSRDSRGKGLRDFAVKAGRWIVDNTEVTTLLNFVEPDRKDLKLFMRMIGSKKIGCIPGTDQILYVSTADMGIREEG